jgi:hypothetical protein
VTNSDVFKQLTRSTGDLAGIFEFEDDVGYFYLYSVEGKEGQKVLDQIFICDADSNLSEEDFSVRWSLDEQVVGLFIRGVLWACFDTSAKRKFGCSYSPGGQPNVPAEFSVAFPSGSGPTD